MLFIHFSATGVYDALEVIKMNMPSELCNLYSAQRGVTKNDR